MFKNIDLNRDFLSKLKRIAIPIFLQSLTMSILSFVDVIMVSQLGETVVAGVSSANQMNLIRIMISFGIATGVGIFAAQYWGSKDVKNIHKFQGIGLCFSIIVGIIFTVLALSIPQQVISLYTKEAIVAQIGGEYFQIISISFIANSISIIFAVVMRSTENVKLPLISSVIGFTLNTGLNALFIFGLDMGYKGAAIATVIARFVEAGLILFFAYYKKLPTASSIKQLLGWGKKDILKFLNISGPVIVHTFFWIVGVNVYTMAFGKVSTNALAAFHICKSIDSLANMVYSSFGNTSGIMIGNQLGAKENKKALTYSYNFFFIVFFLAVICCALFIFSKPILTYILNFSPTGFNYLFSIITVFAVYTFFKAGNIILHMGILRSGGDTKAAMFIDVGVVWLFGVPMAIIGAFLLKNYGASLDPLWPGSFTLPFQYSINLHNAFIDTYIGKYLTLLIAVVSLEEVIKFILGYRRFKSGKWLKTL